MSLQAIAIDSQPMARRAALAVHALGRDDRAWLLAQLPPAQRQRIAPMLEELQALGIPPNRSLLDDTLRSAALAPVAPAKTESEALPVGGAPQRIDFIVQQAALGRLDAAVVTRLLQNEPAGLIAQLMEVQAWPWRQAVLEQLGLVKRRRVEELQDGLRRHMRPKGPEALQCALVAALYRCTVDGAASPQQHDPVQRSTTGAPIGRTRKWRAVLAGWLKPGRATSL